jgi:hypothetical protein
VRQECWEKLHPEPGILKIERISAKARHSSGPFLLSAHFARAKEDNEHPAEDGDQNRRVRKWLAGAVKAVVPGTCGGRPVATGGTGTVKIGTGMPAER